MTWWELQISSASSSSRLTFFTWPLRCFREARGSEGLSEQHMGNGQVGRLMSGACVSIWGLQSWRDRRRSEDLRGFEKKGILKTAVPVESESLKGGLREVEANRGPGQPWPWPFFVHNAVWSSQNEGGVDHQVATITNPASVMHEFTGQDLASCLQLCHISLGSSHLLDKLATCSRKSTHTWAMRWW